MLLKCKIHEFCKFNIIHGSLVPKVVSGIYCKTLHFCRYKFLFFFSCRFFFVGGIHLLVATFISLESVKALEVLNLFEIF